MVRSARISLLTAVAIGFSLPALAAPLKPMSPQDIQATFGTGTPFTSSTPSGTTYTIVLKSDGTASRTPKKGNVITGKWRISTDGYCSTWGKSTENCYKVEKDTGRYRVIDAHGAVVAYWKTKTG